MLIVFDPHSGVPVYRQIIDQVRFHVESGLLEPGDELPSTRTLSAELGVNPMTISKAFRALEADGWVERRPGLPLVVRDRREADAKAGVERLREELAPVVVRVRQLGISRAEAIRTFRKLLEESEEDPS